MFARWVHCLEPAGARPCVILEWAGRDLQLWLLQHSGDQIKASRRSAKAPVKRETNENIMQPIISFVLEYTCFLTFYTNVVTTKTSD